ncbi:glycosyltransferase [Tetragenococcus koreensis]|uniref:glycosyltransferase n=1 Tax=Tetragenococcus koreensis TaxID=290335 RepID=UPI001F3DED02|nr:glycosyltransferase [Tetragenococcus koreensis]MCF1678042.1 glycosyltransferase [Tetragenococcus koreensis]
MSSLSYIEPLIVSKKYNVPVRIIHGHSTRQPGSSFHKFFHRLNQWRIDSIATDYFACSENSAKWLFDKSKVTKNMYTIINNGIQTGKFTFDVKLRDKVRKSLGIEGKLVLGHTGRFAPPKNHDFLIDIFKSVNKFNPNAVLLLIGEGELKPQIEKKVQLNGLDDNVFFLGVRADVGDILQAIDVFIFPSYYEGLPLTLVEAQAADLPCLVSDSITKKVRITDTITYKSLSEKPKTWALKVLNLPKEKRVDKTDSIFKSGYDAFEISTKLMKFYLERLAKY